MSLSPTAIAPTLPPGEMLGISPELELLYSEDDRRVALQLQQLAHEAVVSGMLPAWERLADTAHHTDGERLQIATFCDIVFALLGEELLWLSRGRAPQSVLSVMRMALRLLGEIRGGVR